MSLPEVTVVILAYNRREALQQTLEKMTDSIIYPQERLEIIVVDNASTDGTPEMVAKRFAQVKLLVNEENIGVAGWNRGFRVGKGDYFLILDDDCYLEGDGLRKAVRAAQEQNADLVSFTVESGITPGFVFNERYNTGWLSFWGCAALVSRRAIDQLGGYDPHIFLWTNELEFTMRLLDTGMRHLFLKEVRAVHMKKPKPPSVYDYRAHRLNMKHLAYIAGKLLQPTDALGALVNLLINLLTSALKHPQAFSIVLPVVAGFRQGWRIRQPLRAKVSSVYRWHFYEFVNRLPYKLRYRQPEAFVQERPTYYPSSSGVFSIP
ncbi:MAG TPA: glycosyltransferase [Rhodothermales bacterium]|nr:glycosyltransferase [Rhodothermales bacterium]